MINLRQYMLLKLAEECNEAAQRALKQVQFGRDEVQTGDTRPNWLRLHQELWDVEFWTRALMLDGELPLDQSTVDTRDMYIEAKREKALKYLRLAQSEGQVESGDIL